MARKYHVAKKDDGYGRPKPEHETITDDGEERFTTTITLEGEMMRLGPQQLLGYAERRLAEREQELDRLLRHLPRKYEERIKALDGPRRDATKAIDAAGLLIANARLGAGALEPVPDQETP